ncbi:30S ribosome-binding factor RbfA [Silvanigrella paludirubra]|jgi:ribosome-binding factor A|uniref:Ribosome-binding factor A n=1 Tax=Silvanigrella paludirubra TaxID=2499159 RepID=A0A6N6VTG6_9BACT|nr:30S ribosome-binding factor RbfA [Silvanigrella paludirubra]KAB8037085.1 30S ribosome-binding factor RbfA [Silvanigrella paludirubra]
MATKRMLQLAEQIREHIALMLVRGEISDPRVRGITLNSVKMSPDLQIAKVYFSVLGEKQKRQEAEKGLKQASGYIRRELGKALLVRYTPAVIFHYDDSIEYSVKMGALISKVSDELREDEKSRNNSNDNDFPSDEKNSNHK